MLSVRVLSLATKVFLLVLGVLLGWLYASSFEMPLQSNDFSENVQSIEYNVVFPTVIPDDVEVAAQLAEKVRLLCLVPITRERHKNEAISLKNTWGWHCNELLFVTNELDEYVNASIGIAYNAAAENITP